MAVADELDALIQRLIMEQQVSAARARQLRWVAGELAVAVEHPDFPAVRTLSGLLRDDRVAAYLDLAQNGQLRRRAAAGTGTSSIASMRVRADCLRMLADASGLPLTIVDRAAAPELKLTVPAAQQRRWHGLLAAQTDRPNAPDGHVRMLALLGVVLDTGARAGELTALSVDDLSEDLRTVRIERHPQATSSAAAEIETVLLSETTRAALRRWLTLRAAIVATLQGTTRALWVALRPNHAGHPGEDGRSIPRPPGMPLQPRGLARAYTRAVDEANVLLADTPGWSPLPRRLEQLRRAASADAAG